MRLPCCLCVSHPPFPLNYECSDPMTPESNLAAYFIIPSHQSVTVRVSLLLLLGKGWVNFITPFVAGQRLSKYVPAATNERNNRRMIWCACICIPLLLIGSNSVKTFLRQGRIFRGVVFCPVFIVSKESRRLMLPTTSFYNCILWLLTVSLSQLWK
jgi:hypothetical protein